MRIMDHLIRAVRAAADYCQNDRVAPACILWPDHDRQWEAALPLLCSELPELLILGGYAPDKRMGPAIWLRCAIAGKFDGITLSVNHPPIVYLPGVSRQALRAVEECPDPLKPLAELQYRGVFWSQPNTRDWTILAFLKSEQKGLGLTVAQDNATKEALQRVLDRLLDEDPESLKGKQLSKDHFNKLISVDPIRDLLQWIDREAAFKDARSENEWQTFVDICQDKFAFDPQKDGVLVAAARLAAHGGAWQKVWERYCEAPKRYPAIPEQIGKCQPPNGGPSVNDTVSEGWPQWNLSQEALLLQDLQALQDLPPHNAREKLLDLEKGHGHRRSSVWAELGKAPLAGAIHNLARLAEVTQKSLAAGTLKDAAAGYQDMGWQADDAVVRALANVMTPNDYAAVAAAIRSVYLPWAEDAARHLQKIVTDGGYPLKADQHAKSLSENAGQCILFVDGLRFDAGKRLAAMLTRSGFSVKDTPAWVALPSVTATGKPAASPARSKIKGAEGCVDFEPVVAETGQSLKGGHHLKKLLKEAGWTLLEGTDNGDGQGKAWCEFGNIDHEGHHSGWKMARNLNGLLMEIHARIQELISAGWQQVTVVTDHGWLLMPNGLPKIDLPSVLVDSKWGRCAFLKSGAVTDEHLFPWYWDENQSVALAGGISCYRKGLEYTHGGLSLQECLVVELSVGPGDAAATRASVQITDVVWKGMRCKVAIEGEASNLSLDIRAQAGNAASSVVMTVKAFKTDGIGSVVVDNDELEGTAVFIVILNDKNKILSQQPTVVGGDSA